ncbi:hypothetical protein G7Y89_g976 [Cudoniella acicularis]|uniref:CENP-V/GFA domain-containing protein n=1 Tax=Cudoniella acicularis TaxID=354080 RepID=A0A8H4RW67_9HELO|nr:hypothetical protein G7Y89_g976 [Cudoniella acicularis]
MESINITATCACRSFAFDTDLPTSSLPRVRALCLCTKCRRISGGCGISYITIDSAHLDLSKYNLTKYSSSDIADRYFCSTCGCHVFVTRLSNDSWHLATGIWDRTEGIIEWTGCKWVEDTLDGGVSVWLKEIVDQDGSTKALKRWMLPDRGGELVPEGTFETLPKPSTNLEDQSTLKAQCACGGVKFYITRPDEASKALRSPFPDLMVPYHSGSSANPENKTWWLCSNNTKYLAGLCTCTSCRQASGFEIQPWAFVPKCNIFQEDGSPLDFNMGTLKNYESSAGVEREFCGVCGATVFWHCEERPDLIDVSIGLLDPNEGARVEAWLHWWTNRVSFSEMAVSKSLVSSLEKGLKSWTQKD